MKRMQSVGVGVVLAVTLLVGCGHDEQPSPEPQPNRCDSPTEYAAFNSANLAPQELELKRIDDILALFDEA
jgi:hypothetical protein